MQELAPGVRLGPYRVEGVLGTGGMGQVYKAHDTRLGRAVAIKISSERFSKRFEQEARAISALSHPHICTLYDVGPDYLVMELVEGQTLADCIAEAPIHLDKALSIAAQIAEALDAAHEKGIIHRDLKPANVKITPCGAVKVLDFGVAKTSEAASDGQMTVTFSVTEEGAVVGTPAYMSPEQAQGKTVDKRTDIWALGVMLYEMLAGEHPFRRTPRNEMLATILTTEPDWVRIPQKARGLVRRCLERDPRRRLRDMGDFRFLVEDLSAVDSAAAPKPLPWRLLLACIVITALTVSLGFWTWFWPDTSVTAEPVRMTVLLPPGVSITRGPSYASSLALSPDGRTLVIAGTAADGKRLYQRRLDRLEVTPLEGTDGGSSPFFSPDGAWIGFYADGWLRRMPTGGGPVADITALPRHPQGASWGPYNRIAFVSGARSRVSVVGAEGGEVAPLTNLAAGEFGHASPEFLPDGRTVLFESPGWIHALDVPSGRRTTLVQGVAPRYALSGHLILSRRTALLAAPFNLSRVELTGPVIPCFDGVAHEHTGTRHYAISHSGAVVYLPDSGAHSLVLVDADGTEQLVTEKQVSFENPQFAPIGRRLVVAMTRRRDEPADLWIHEIDTGLASRLTFGGGRAPVWTPDGEAITFSHRGEQPGIYSKRADGRGDARRLIALDEFHWLIGWTPDGQTLAYGVMEGQSDDETSPSSIMAFVGGRSHRVVGPGSNWGGRLSPNGRWLTYYSLESGRFEVYVTPFPDGGTRWLISDDEGHDPNWSPNGTEVYYRSGNRLLAAQIDTNAGVRVLSRRLVLQPFSPPLYDVTMSMPTAAWCSCSRLVKLSAARPRWSLIGLPS